MDDRAGLGLLRDYLEDSFDVLEKLLTQPRSRGGVLRICISDVGRSEGRELDPPCHCALRRAVRLTSSHV